MFHNKVKAGALQLTIFIVVIIALLLSSFLIYISAYKNFKVKTAWVVQTVQNSNKGITYAIQNKIPLGDSVKLKNKEDYKKSTLYRDFWGIYEKVSAKSKIKNYTTTKIALLGAAQSKENRLALYVEDNNKSLILVGNTRIQGMASLPAQGVKPGNIAGKYYYGGQLIYGHQKQSSKLPKINSETFDEISRIQKENERLNQSRFLDISKQQLIQNSFYKPLKIIYSTHNLRLSEIKLTGHIIVQSKTKITVERTAKLKDVILIAPKIEIKKHVRGVFQAFATKNITIGENTRLNYPSALVLKPNKTNTDQQNSNNQSTEEHSITIEKNATVKGIIAYLGEYDPNNYQPQIEIEKNAQIKGELYCTNNIELKGKVYGSVFTANFIANQAGSIYQNHLYNAQIRIDSLPQEYTGLEFKNPQKRDVVKWLY